LVEKSNVVRGLGAPRLLWDRSLYWAPKHSGCLNSPIGALLEYRFALKSYPLLSILEQIVTILTRFRCHRFLSASDSAVTRFFSFTI
jgi:hypothetical protein